MCTYKRVKTSCWELLLSVTEQSWVHSLNQVVNSSIKDSLMGEGRRPVKRCFSLLNLSNDANSDRRKKSMASTQTRIATKI